MYLATEYMKMGSLMDLLQILGDKINEQQMLEMCFDAALGMAYLERSRIVHRDLNCRNLLVSTDDHGKYTVKVGDFSHAKCGEISRKFRGEFSEKAEMYSELGRQLHFEWCHDSSQSEFSENFRSE